MLYIRPTTTTTAWYPDQGVLHFLANFFDASERPLSTPVFTFTPLPSRVRFSPQAYLLPCDAHTFFLLFPSFPYIFHAVHSGVPPVLPPLPEDCTEDAVLQFLHFPLLYRFLAINWPSTSSSGVSSVVMWYPSVGIPTTFAYAKLTIIITTRVGRAFQGLPFSSNAVFLRERVRVGRVLGVPLF